MKITDYIPYGEENAISNKDLAIVSGYAVSVCYGYDEARRDILRYLELEKPNRR